MTIGTETDTSTLNTLLKGTDMGNLFGAGNGSTTEGLVLGMLLGRGGLFGNNGNGLADGAGGAMLRIPPEQATANMSLMSGIGDLKQAVAVGVATTETSNANQTGQLTAAVLSSTSANQIAVSGVKDVVNANSVVLMQQLNTVNTNIMESKYEIAQTITNDGDKTRALITANMVTELNNQIADLRTQRAVDSGNVTVTNNINQNQLQMQQQQQLVTTNGLLQQLLAEQRITQGVLNIGSGTVSGNSQTAANTRVA